MNPTPIAVFDLDDTVFALQDFILPHLNAYANTDHKQLLDYNWVDLFNITHEECKQVLKQSNYIYEAPLRHPAVLEVQMILV